MPGAWFLLSDEDYPWLATLDEVLVIALLQVEEARRSQTGLELGVHLKMASRAMRCALEMFGEHLETKGTA